MILQNIYTPIYENLVFELYELLWTIILHGQLIFEEIFYTIFPRNPHIKYVYHTHIGPHYTTSM